MRIKSLTSALFAMALLATSCSVPKNITYFQDLKENQQFAPIQTAEIKVRPEDKLQIYVSTQDPSLTQLFNLMGSGTQGGMMMGSNGQGMMYTVTPEGTITFPVLGDVKVAGLRRWEVADRIENLLTEKALVKQPIVTVEYGNTAFTAVGEIGSPGRIEFNRDRLSIVDAVAMAGDIRPTGLKENVTLIRENPDGTSKVYKLNFNDMASLSSSPAYWVQQNDVIYVEPSDMAKRNTTPNGNSMMTPAFWMSMVTFAISIGTLVASLAR